MEKLKGYGAIFMGCLSCFMYGAYVDGVIHRGITIEPHRWILTGMFGLFFMFYGIDKIKKL